jgi:hypothetical protein
MNKAIFDFDFIGTDRLSVYVPVNSHTKELRSELKRLIGRPSTTYAFERRGVIAEEWSINNGRSVYGMLANKSAWQTVFGGKQTQYIKEFGQFFGQGGTI